MKEILALLLLQYANALENVTRRLRDGELTVEEWQAEFLKLIAFYLALGYSKGLGEESLTPTQLQQVGNAVAIQASYLDGFAQDVEATGWQDEYLARSRLYAESARELFWRGTVDCVELPIYPSSSKLDCGQFCKCYLTFDWIDKDNCDVDIRWHTTHAEVSPDCQMLEQKWNPLRVRGGIIING